MKVVIDANQASFFSFKDLRSFKSLLLNLAKRDFSVRYKQALAGIIWALLKPLVNILVFGYISTKISGAGNASLHFLYVASAMLLWQLFSNVFSDVSNSIVGNSNLFSKVYFPKIIIPLSTLLVCLVDFLISLLILLVLFIVNGQAIDWPILLAPVFVLLTVINGLGLGLYFATINVKYRDVKFIVPLLLQLGMYLSPVIFSSTFYLERIPEWLHWLFCLNPMVGAIEGFKYALFGEAAILNAGYFALSIGISFLFLWLGIKYFYRYEQSFVDHI